MMVTRLDVLEVLLFSTQSQEKSRVLNESILDLTYYTPLKFLAI